ncbi:hypothetical protein M0805_006618, partial [Coniferiporia weirii]
MSIVLPSTGPSLSSITPFVARTNTNRLADNGEWQSITPSSRLSALPRAGYDEEDAKEKLYTHVPVVSFKGLETPVVGGSGAGKVDVRTDNDVEAAEFMIRSLSEDNEEDNASDEEEGEDLTTVPSPLRMCKKSMLMRTITRGQARGFPSPDGLILFDKRIQMTEAETIETLATIGFLGERQKQAIDSL